MNPAHSCRACRSTNLVQVLDLGLVPGSDTFPPMDEPSDDPRWPLELYMCDDCALAQLGPRSPLAVDEQGAVESATARAHAARSVDAIARAEGLGPGNTVIEIDSGHGGSWLPAFTGAGLKPQPPDARADLVVDLHGLMHEPDLDAAAAAHVARLAPDGRLVCEFYYLGALVEGSLIDTIRHGHFSYLSFTSASRLFARHGMQVCRAERVPMFGGSLRVTLRRRGDATAADDSVVEIADAEARAGLDRSSGLATLGDRGRAAATALRELLASARDREVTVAGYGAPSKAAVLLAIAGVGPSLLPYTVDMSQAKHGGRIPGARVPIRPVDALLDERPDEVVLLTWDIADEVISQLTAAARHRDWTPRFWAPLPVPGYVRATSG